MYFLDWICSALALGSRYHYVGMLQKRIVSFIWGRDSFMGHLVVSPEAVVELKASFNVSSFWKVISQMKHEYEERWRSFIGAEGRGEKPTF